MQLSYAHGSSETPLIGETIGANFERIVERLPGAEALVSRHQELRYTYAELNEAVDRLAAGLIAVGLEKGERVGIWSPNCAEWVLTQFATAKAGIILVNINPAYRTSELLYAQPVGLPLAGLGPVVQGLRLPVDDGGGAARGPEPRAHDLPRHGGVGRAAGRRRRRGPRRRRRPRGRAELRRPDQHPVHERHDGRAQGRHPLAPQNP